MDGANSTHALKRLQVLGVANLRRPHTSAGKHFVSHRRFPSQNARVGPVVRWSNEQRPGNLQRKLGADAGDITEELCFSERFLLEEQLGRGSFGTVHRATDAVTGEVVAIKKIAARKASKEAKNEASQLRSLQGVPGVVKLHGFYDDFGPEQDVDAKTSCIIMQLCTGGDLDKFCEEEGPLSEEQVRAVAVEVISMLEGCHSRGILHLDVKAANLLIDSRASREKLKTSPQTLSPGWLLASDFGTARVAGLGYCSEFLGSPKFCAPEVFGRKYREPADLWSAGTMLFSLHSNRMPFWQRCQEDKMRSKNDILRHILLGTPEFGARMDPDFQDFLQGLLHKDPAQRLTASQALTHPWLGPQ